MHGGGSRQFGYDRQDKVYVGPHPEEAPIVREIAERIVGGEGLKSIARDLNRREVRTPSSKRKPDGGEWTSQGVSQMIRSPRLAALRVYGGEEYQGAWEAVLSVATRNQVLAALSHPGPSTNVPRHLLTGIARCGLCGDALRMGWWKMPNGRTFPRYQCLKSPGTKGCGRLACTKVGLESEVKNRLLEALSSAQLRPLGDVESRLVEARRLLDEEVRAIKDLTDARYVDRIFGDAEFRPALVKLQDRRRDLLEEIVALDAQVPPDGPTLKPGDIDSLQAWWETASEGDRRQAVRDAVQAVVVSPARRRGGNVFDPSRVDVQWRWDFYLHLPEVPYPDPDPIGTLLISDLEEMNAETGIVLASDLPSA